METLNPPPPLNLEGNVAEIFRKWKQRFKLYMDATGATGKEKAQQCAILLHVVGEEALEVYNTFNLAGDDPDPVIDKFEEYCNPLKNLTFERHKFFIRCQEKGETMDQYVTDLKNKSKSCEFGNLCDSLIKDRIVCGITDVHVRERLLREPKLTLEKTVTICRASELSKSQMKGLALADDQEKAVHVVKKPGTSSTATKQGWSSHANSTHRGRGRGRGQNRNERSQSKCTRCGYEHKYKNGTCPAKGKKCHKCQGMDHFSSMCRSKNVHTVEEDELFIGIIVNIDMMSQTEWQTELNVNGHSMKLKLDTGAQANVISGKLFDKVKTVKHRLQKSMSRLTTYSGEKIPVRGVVDLRCRYCNKVVVLPFMVVDLDSPPVLGLQACEELNLIQRTCTCPSIHQVKQMTQKDILDEYSEIFSGTGCLPEEHHIQIDVTVKPVVHPPRRVPVALRDKLKKELDRMESTDIIEKVDVPTDWVNSMVVVEKTNGKLRICLDPKDLNTAIKREHFPIPTSDEVSSKLSGAKVFSKLDASSGFWQIPLDDESSRLCTFNTPEGRYRFKRLPFGISNAPEVFHKTVRKMLDGLDGVLSIIDDILIWGSTKEEHDRHLRETMDRILQGGLKLNKEKCQIQLTEVTYFGHTYSAEGRSPDKNKVEAVVGMPVPESKKDLERFLGMVTYIAKFVPGYSTVSAPLRDLLKKDVLWEWNSHQQQAFDKLKDMVTSAPVLKYFDPKKPVKLSVDASQSGLGAVLLQEEGPVEYASRSLTATEKGYAQIEKDMLAIVYGCERFHQYVYGQDVTVESDHKPLQSIMKKALFLAPARLQRLMLRLQKYQLNVTYRPGATMYIADQLSRAYLNDNQQSVGISEELEAQVHMVINSLPISPEKLSEIKQATNNDTEMRIVMQMVKTGWPEERSQVPLNIRTYWPYRDEIMVSDGILFKGGKLIVPKQMRKEMVQKIHSSHMGIEKSRARARDILFWPGMSSDIEEHIMSCATCNQFRNSNPREPLQQHDIPERPWEKVGLDLFQYQDNMYLVAIDYYSKFVELFLLKTDTRSQTVITHLKSLFARQGIPDEVMSDNGPQFSSDVFKSFSKQWDFKHTTSSPRYPRSNGMVERAVQTVKNLLKKAANDGRDPYLALLEYRNTPVNEKESPAQLLMSRRLKTPIPVSAQLLKPEVITNVRDCLEDRQRKQKFYYDRGTKLAEQLGKGQSVRVQSDDKKEWHAGTVVEQDSGSSRSYRVERKDGSIVRRNRSHIIPVREKVVHENFEDNASSLSRDKADLEIEEGGDNSSTESPSGTSTANAYVTRSGRQSKNPSRFDDYEVYWC